LYEALARDERVEIVRLTPELLDRWVALFRSRADKEWPLTDCISFVVMQDHELAEALTADHHFVQAGFKALLA
jgi:predicted nucleic acid-binding protein